MNGRRRHRHTPRQVAKGLLYLALVLAAMAGVWLATGLALDPLARALGLSGPPTWLRLVHFFVAFAAFGLAFAFFSRLLFRRRPDFFAALGDAFRRVGQGDLSVSLAAQWGERDERMGHFAGSFDSMVASLRQMEELRQEFISTVSHEFQSPLTSIVGFAAALRSDALEAATRDRYLAIIEQQSRRLSRLSESLLSLSSLESRGLRPERAPFRLDEQIRRVALAAEPQWAAKRIELGVDLAPAEFVGDAEALERVWTNLLHNAVKFSPPGGTIGLRLAADGDWWRVEVEDGGVGLDEAALPRVFERFWKADPARSGGEGGGAGLGLAIVKKVVELHGGRVAAASAGLGRGSRFSVWLPAGARAAARA